MSLTGYFGSHQANGMAKHFIRFLGDNGFELSRFKKMLRRFEECEKNVGFVDRESGAEQWVYKR